MYFRNKINLTTASDITILLFAVIVFATYQYGKNLLPEFLLYFLQMALLWFVLRIVLRFFPKYKTVLLVGLLGWGLLEAIWGLGQLYGFSSSKLSLFKISGSFFNPGPYGGFIALLFPLALHGWLFYRNKNKLIGYLFLFAGAVCLMVLPATMSRTAWIAAITGCLLVLAFDRRLLIKSRIFWKRHKKQCVFGAVILSLFLVVATYGLYHIKRDIHRWF